MSSHIALKHALAAKLLSVVADQAAAEGKSLPVSADEVDAVLAINAIRCIIGQVVNRHPPGPSRDSLKLGLATALGDPMGQLLGGQADHLAAAALEGFVQIMGVSFGADTRVNVEISAPTLTNPSHLKVVQ